MDFLYLLSVKNLCLFKTPWVQILLFLSAVTQQSYRFSTCSVDQIITDIGWHNVILVQGSNR